MKCPVDGAELKVSDREGVEIDYCPKCRGIWLDRGELDKIIDRYDGGGMNDEDDRRGGRRNNRNDDDEEGGFLGNIFGGFGGRDD
jgi:Zn-finger nucleic acid-binding protein